MEHGVLIGFIVTFPVLVFIAFLWLVAKHHEKLYSPQDFQNDATFENIAHHSKLAKIHADVEGTIAEAMGGESLDVGMVRRVQQKVTHDSFITVDPTGLIGVESRPLVLPFEAFNTIDDLTDEIFLQFQQYIPPYDYGRSWLLINRSTGKPILTRRIEEKVKYGQPSTDLRPLSDFDISPGTIIGIERPEFGKVKVTRYLVSKNAMANGDHEVHAAGCSFMPDAENQLYLGEFSSCAPAISKAKEIYPQSNGCHYCVPECATR